MLKDDPNKKYYFYVFFSLACVGTVDADFTHGFPNNNSPAAILVTAVISLPPSTFFSLLESRLFLNQRGNYTPLGWDVPLLNVPHTEHCESCMDTRPLVHCEYIERPEPRWTCLEISAIVECGERL